MDRFAAAMQRAMRQKFRHIGRVALYYTSPAASPSFILVDITDRYVGIGQLQGSGSAEMLSDSPTIEFLSEQITPVRGAYVAVSPGVAYQLDTVEPPEQFTTVAKAARMRPDRLKGFRYPSQEAITAISGDPSLINSDAVNPKWIVEEW